MRMQTGLALIVLVMALALPSLAQVGAAQPFKDVPPDHWAARAVADLAAAGILEGRPDGTYNGQKLMTRYEVAAALARMMTRLEKEINAGGTPLPGSPVTLEQIRQMILTNPEVQAKLRGPQGPAGAPGKDGAPATVDQLKNLILNDADVQNKLRGPAGAKGDKGDTGPAGTVTPAQIQQAIGLTPKQVADLLKLLNEFGPEIAAIRGDVRTLSDKVNALEQAVTKIPPLRASITGGVRAGIQGTSLELSQDAGVAVDNTNIFNSANTGAADNTLAKDLNKGARYMVSLFDLSIDGTLNDGAIAGHAAFRAVTPVSFDAAPYNLAVNTPIVNDATQGYAVLSNGVSTFADSVQLWDWYATFSTGVLGKDLSVTAGRHSNSIASGLLVDTSRQPLLGLSVDTAFDPINVGVNLSLIDRASSPLTLDPVAVQDAMAYIYFGWNIKDWSLVGTWLQSGFAEQQGWSVAADGTLFNTHVFGEFAELTSTATGIDPAGNSGRGWLVGADIINNWKGFSLTGKYGQILSNFRPAFSAIYPYAAVNAYDTNWIDRPLFLDPNNVTKGWEADMRLALSKSLLLTGRVYDGKTTLPGPTSADADMVWIIGLKHQMTNNVAASFVYGQRDVQRVAPATSDLKTFRVGLEFML